MEKKACRRCSVLKPLTEFVPQRAATVINNDGKSEINIAARIHSRGFDCSATTATVGVSSRAARTKSARMKLNVTTACG